MATVKLLPVNRQHISLGARGCLQWSVRSKSPSTSNRSYALQGVPAELLEAVKKDRLLKEYMSPRKDLLDSATKECKQQKCEVEAPTTVFINTARKALGEWMESLSTTDLQRARYLLQSDNHDPAVYHLQGLHRLLLLVLQNGLEEGAVEWFTASQPEDYQEVFRYLLLMTQDSTAISHLLPFCVDDTTKHGWQRHRRVRSAPQTSQRGTKALQFSRHSGGDAKARPRSASLNPEKQATSFNYLKLMALNWRTNVQLRKEHRNTTVEPQAKSPQWPTLPKTLFEIRTPRRLVPHNHRSLLPHPPFILQRPQPGHFFLRSA